MRLDYGKTEGGAQVVKAGGQDGAVFWVREESFISIAGSDEQFPTYNLIWGMADSPWLFGAQADTAEHLDALVTAFVAPTKAGRR